MRRLLPLILLVALGATTACGSVEPYAAKVNDTVIVQDDLESELDAIGGNTRYVEGLQERGLQVRGSGKDTFDAGFVAQVLSRQVLLELVHQEAVRRGIQVSEAKHTEVLEDIAESYGGEEIFKAFPKVYQDLVVRRTAEVSEVQAALAPPVDEAEVRRRYESNRAQYTETCVRHILFSALGPDGRPDRQAVEAQAAALQAQAEQVRAQIEAGADFAALAAEHSADAGSRAQGGDLRCQPPGQLVPEFESAMDQLEPGQVSPPVRTQFGVHLVQVTDRRVRPFDQVADEIRQELQQQGGRRFDEVLAEVASAAKVSVNPRYGRFEKEPQPRVVPPTPPQVPGGSTPAPSPLAP